MGLLDCRVSGLHFPLLAVIDFRGYTISAQSIVPIDGPSSLLYGSADGGKTIHCKDPVLTAKMRATAKILNLKGHYVQPKYGEKVFLYGPTDIEGHRGRDGRYYILGT